MSDSTLVCVSGEIDLLTETEFSYVLARHLTDGAAQVRLDLSQIRFISVEGYAVLESAVAEARSRGVIVRVDPSRAVSRLTALLAPMPSLQRAA